jgi:hypothetical protein
VTRVQWSRFAQYYFYIRDEVLGPIVMRVASSFPFRTSYYLNGHSFIEQQTAQQQIRHRFFAKSATQCSPALKEVRDNSGEGGKMQGVADPNMKACY